MEDDTLLTKKAIEEIVREMNETQEREQYPQAQERKVNPLGRANKRFLGRTLNSMLTHNKREDDRTQERCRRKLQELDKRSKRRNVYAGHDRNQSGKPNPHRRSRSESSHEILTSSASSGNGDAAAESRNRVKRKKIKRAQKSCSRSRSDSSSSSSVEVTNYRRENGDGEYIKSESSAIDADCQLIVDPYAYAANSGIYAAVMYNHYLQYQAALTKATTGTESIKSVEKEDVAHADIENEVYDAIKDEDQCEVEILEGCTISVSNSSAASSDTDDSSLSTIDLTSDEEADGNANAKREGSSSVELLNADANSNDSAGSASEADSHSVASCICLDTDTEQENEDDSKAKESVSVDNKTGENSNSSIANISSSVPDSTNAIDKGQEEIMVDLTDD